MPGNLSPPLILSKMSEYQDGRGYLTDSQSSRGTTNDGSWLCSRRPIASPQGEPIKIWCIKPCHIPCLTRLLWPGSADLRISPGCANPNKALYCLILWLIDIYSSAEPKKTFHLPFYQSLALKATVQQRTTEPTAIVARVFCHITSFQMWNLSLKGQRSHDLLKATHSF